MNFLKKKFDTIKCSNGCVLFEDRSNYSYWENNEVTSDEKEITEFLNQSELSENKNLLHIGVGNSHIAQNLKNYSCIDGITISNNELKNAHNLNISNYNIYLKNKYSSGDLLKNRIGFYDFIIDNNLKSFACCNNAFEDLISKYKNYLKNNGSIISSLRGMRWSRIVKPVYSFSFKKLFYKRLKEFDGPIKNLMNKDDCLELCNKFNLQMIEISTHLVQFIKKK
tara:strand:- start:203 stop:874 length:672 start_codon:yes stop_codon:yes gene_type:complete